MFSIYGKLFKTLTKMGDFLILGVLTALFSIPVVTLGGSVTAAFYVALKLNRDEEGYVWKDFLHSFKGNVLQGFFLELIIGAIGLFIFEDIRICMYWMESGSSAAAFVMYAFFGMALVLIAVALFAFPMLAKFDNTVIATLKNAMILSMHHLGQTFVMILADGILAAITVKFFTAVILTLPIAIYVNSYILSRVFRIYEKQATEEANPDASADMTAKVDSDTSADMTAKVDSDTSADKAEGADSDTSADKAGQAHDDAVDTEATE